jgi:hypothetical protein
VSTTQALAWPQIGQVDAYGRIIPATIVPQVIQQATACYALALLREASATGATGSDATIKSKKFGDTTIVYQDRPSSARPSMAARMPPEIQLMLREYGMIRGGIMVPLYRS